MPIFAVDKNKRDMKTEEVFMSLAPMISTDDGKVAYLRIGRGLAYGKVWCDYVRAGNGERVFLNNKFYPTIKKAVNALFEVVVNKSMNELREW